MDKESTVIELNNSEGFHDYKEVLMNYEELKKTYKSRPVLSKYERTKIIGLRAQQIASQCEPLIDVPKHMTNTIDIATLEFKKRKTPFILKKMVGNKPEYWKLEDLIYYDDI